MRRVSVLFISIGLGLLGCSERRPAPHPTPEVETKNTRSTADRLPRNQVFAPTQEAYPAQVAGGFYTDDPKVLRAQVTHFLNQAKTADIDSDRDIVGLLAPHAGYPYSGPVAGQTYKAVMGRGYRTVIVLALSHRRRAAKASVLDRPAYRTPLGAVPINRRLVHDILTTHGDLFEANEKVFLGEHSLEVQLPFIQIALPTTTVIPIIIAVERDEIAGRIGRALFDMFGNSPDILFVVSSDFSHFYPYDEAKQYDLETLSLLQKWHIEAWRTIGRTQRGMCGYMPTLTFLRMFEKYPAKKRTVSLISYKNSGDTAGDKSRVVGYGSLAFSLENGMRTEKETEKDFGPFSANDRRVLMELAKNAVAAAANRTNFQPDEPESKLLSDPGAAFVTLKKKGQLRGCIGHVVARVPLFKCIADVARSAAVQDMRFSPVSPEELNDLTYEISVLTTPEPTTAEQVVVGRDGLIMSRGGRSGLLLPQVPIEWNWDREQFLQHTCRKAGLPLDCWKDQNTEIKSFQAIIWGEDDLE
jgi:hypothetical protein